LICFAFRHPAQLSPYISPYLTFPSKPPNISTSSRLSSPLSSSYFPLRCPAHLTFHFVVQLILLSTSLSSSSHLTSSHPPYLPLTTPTTSPLYPASLQFNTQRPTMANQIPTQPTAEWYATEPLRWSGKSGNFIEEDFSKAFQISKDEYINIGAACIRLLER